MFTASLIIMYVTRPFLAWELEDKAGNLSQFCFYFAKLEWADLKIKCVFILKQRVL